MTYQMLGITDPPGFDRAVAPALIRALHIDSVFEARDIGTRYDDRMATGARGPWFDDLTWRLAQVAPVVSLPRLVERTLRRFAPPSLRAAIRRRLPFALRP